MIHRLWFGVVVLVVASVPAAAEAPVIEHQPVACVAAGRFPQLEARIAPPQSVAKARVLFQPEGGRHWYGVAMKPTGAVFSAVLPRPKKSLKAYRYYLEVTDTALGTSRTPEYSTVVATSGATCADKKIAGSLGSAAVTLEVPAGAPSVPGGFSASGVIAVGAGGAAVAAGTITAAAGGGIPAAVLIGGGLAVAGAGVAVAASASGGGGGGSATSYEGPFNGQFSITLLEAVAGANGSVVTCTGTSSFAGTATVTLDQTSGAVNGTIQTNGSHTQISGACLASVPLSWTAPLTGTAGSITASSQQGPTTSPFAPAMVTMTNVFEFSGALSGGVITGVLTFTQSQQGLRVDGSRFSGDASVTIPVTLRQR